MSLITLRCFMGCCPHKSAVAYALSAYILYAAYTRLRSRSVGVWRSSPPLGSSPHVLLGLMRCDSVCTPLWKGNIKQHPSLSPAQDSNYSAHTRMYASVYAQQFKPWPSRAGSRSSSPWSVTSNSTALWTGPQLSPYPGDEGRLWDVVKDPGSR